MNQRLELRIRAWDLSQPFGEEISRMQGFPSPKIATIPGRRAHVQEITTWSHVGTHVDAPLHVIPDGQSLDEIPFDAFVGPGIVLDVAKDGPTAITMDDVSRAGGDVIAGDCVLFHTGWGSKFGTDGYDPHPYISEQVAEWLVERDVRMVGIDTLTPDVPKALRTADYSGIIHRTLLGNGLLILENVADMSSVVGRRLFIIAAPINVVGGDGGLVRVVALAQDGSADSVDGTFPE